MRVVFHEEAQEDVGFDSDHRQAPGPEIEAGVGDGGAVLRVTLPAAPCRSPENAGSVVGPVTMTEAMTAGRPKRTKTGAGVPDMDGMM